MTSAKSINSKQKEVMAEFMSEHPNLARNLLPNCGQGRIASNRLWETLTLRLNSFGPPTKNAKSWRKVFTDQKFSVKKKVSLNKALKKKTGGGAYEEIPLTSAEEQILQAAGIDVAVEGLSNVKSFGCRENTNATPPNDIDQTIQYLMDRSPASEDDSEHEGHEVNTSKSASQCSAKPVSESYTGCQNKEDKSAKKSSTLSTESVTKLELLKSNISKVEEHQKNTTSKLDRLIELKERSLKLKEEQHAAESNISKVEEHQTNMASKLDRLIQLKERSLKLNEEQHAANMKIKMVDLEIKTIELEMLKKQM